MPVQVDGSSQSNGASIYQAAVGGIAQIKRVGLMVPKAKGHAEQCTLLNSKCLRMIPILEEIVRMGPEWATPIPVTVMWSMEETNRNARAVVNDCCALSSLRLMIQGKHFAERFNAVMQLIDMSVKNLQDAVSLANQVQPLSSPNPEGAGCGSPAAPLMSETDANFVSNILKDLKARGGGAAGEGADAFLSARLAEHLGRTSSTLREELDVLRREKEALLREKSKAGEKYFADVLGILEESGDLANKDELVRMLEERFGSGHQRRDSRRESLSPEPPDSFLCPVSLQVMVDPVIVAATGITYDRASIQLWFSVGNNTCPKTNQHLESRMLTPNYALKKLIEDWARENGIELPKAPILPAIVEVPPEPRSSAEAVDAAARMLRSEQLEERVRAAETIKVLARGDELRAVIARTGVFPILVSMLGTAEHGSNEQAAGALRNLACNSSENKVAIAQAGAIPPLVAMLSMESANSQQEAAGALRNLACNDDNKVIIAAEHAIAPLVRVLLSGCAAAKEEAAGALKNLACNNAVNKVAIVQSGAIAPLVEMLRSGGGSAQREAAGALSNLAGNNAANKMAIAHAGAIVPLVEVVRSGTVSAQEEAAGVLRNLAGNNSDARVADSIAKAGAIPPLVDLLRSSSPGAQKEAAGALRNLACNNADNKVAIIKAGAVPPLVALLGSSEPSAQQEAAAALGNLACNDENKSIITQEGAVEPLLSVLRSGNTCAQEHAVFALRRLRVSNIQGLTRGGRGGRGGGDSGDAAAIVDGAGAGGGGGGEASGRAG